MGVHEALAVTHQSSLHPLPRTGSALLSATAPARLKVPILSMQLRLTGLHGRCIWCPAFLSAHPSPSAEQEGIPGLR